MGKSEGGTEEGGQTGEQKRRVKRLAADEKRVSALKAETQSKSWKKTKGNNILQRSGIEVGIKQVTGIKGLRDKRP